MATSLRTSWTPHAGQRAVLSHGARFRVVVAGRRWGKNDLAAHEVFRFAVENPESLIWWVGPNYDDANDYGFDRIRPLVPDELLDKDPKRTKPRKLWINGTEIAFQSAEHELKGAGLDLVVVDEGASIPRRTIENELRPMLTDTLGSALVVARPRGRNWLHEWFVRGQSPEWPAFASWQAPTAQNPYIERSEIAAARREVPERVFRQEWLAEFIDDSGGVFENVRQRVGSHETPVAPEAVSPPVYVGVDLGRASNYTAIVALDGSGRVVAFRRLRRTSWSAIEAAIETLASDYQAAVVALDSTRDNKLIEDLAGTSSVARVVPVRFTATKKSSMVESLAAGLERSEVVLPANTPILVNELELFEFSETPAGNVRYGAPSGKHDDAVDAACLAYYASRTSGSVDVDDSDPWVRSRPGTRRAPA